MIELKEVKLPTKPKVEEKFGLQKGGRVQQVIDSEVLRRMDPFTPKDTGALIDNGLANTVVGSGEITYNSPYARRQYYIPMNHEGQRCDYWFEQMKAAGGKEAILKAARKAAGNG